MAGTCGSALAVDALEPVAGASVVVLNSAGEVSSAPSAPKAGSKTFFAEERPFHGCLSFTVRRWVCQELAAFQSGALSVRPPQPLAVRARRECLYALLH